MWSGFVAARDAVGGRYREDCHVADVIEDPRSRLGVRSYALNLARANDLGRKSQEMVSERFPLNWRAIYFPLIGASAHDCKVMTNGSGETLICPRNGQSSAMIITMTRASVAATVPVIARCRPKFSKPKKYV